MKFGGCRPQTLLIIANILAEETRLSLEPAPKQTGIEKAEGEDSPLDIEETTTLVEIGIHSMPEVKPKKKKKDQPEKGLGYLGQNNYRNAEATARGKDLVKKE